MLQMTTGAMIAPPLALTTSEVVAHHVGAVDPNIPDMLVGPFRRLEGRVIVWDKSATPPPFHGEALPAITLDIAHDGRGVLTVAHSLGTPDVVVLLPAETGRALNHALFVFELDHDRRIRLKREAGYVDCTFCA